MTEQDTTGQEFVVEEWIVRRDALHLLNAGLRGAGVDEVRPQMLYNYTTARLRKGERPMIASVEREDGETYINREALTEFARKRIAKKTATKVQHAPLAI